MMIDDNVDDTVPKVTSPHIFLAVYPTFTMYFYLRVQTFVHLTTGVPPFPSTA